MTVRAVLNLVTSPFELRSGSHYLFAKISPENVRCHLDEEVEEIRARGKTLVIRSSVPDYELDVNDDVDDDLLPWY